MTALDHAQEMIRRASPSFMSNQEVSDYAEEILRNDGFETERLEYKDGDGILKVNIIGKKGSGNGGLTFFGHTDTVPADNWAEGDPFTPFVRDGLLYGRGSCDMKGPVGCAFSAAARFTDSDLKKPLYIVCTADEEVGYGGAKDVVARSRYFDEIKSGTGIITEPTMLKVVYAHKGCLGLVATSRGHAAHSSTTKGTNANLAMIPFLADMKLMHDELMSDPQYQNTEFDPPTPGWNIGINDGNTARNITAPQSICTVYYRPMPGNDIPATLSRVQESATRNGLELEIIGSQSTVYTDPNSKFVQDVLRVADSQSPTTAPYGTDGLAFGNHMPLVVLGPGDIAQAHTVDEWIELDQIEKGTELYSSLIDFFCVSC